MPARDVWTIEPKGTMPQYKRYREELQGLAVSDLWDDIDRINPVGGERLGDPTQKPEALLDRIIEASSNEGEVVLDPFCGCGTAIAVAQKLERRWIGIDITHLAVTLIRSRLTDAFQGKAQYEVVGEPVSRPDAEALAVSDPYQFQWWALGLVGARPVEQKKGADKGIDGRTSPWGKHPRLQILTVEDLLTGRGIDRPPAQASATFKRAPKAQASRVREQSLDFSASTADE